MILVVMFTGGWIMWNFKSILRGLTTNRATLEADSADPMLRPREISLTPTDTADRIETWVKTRSGWGVESRSDQNGSVKLHLTRTTRAFRFVDDIHITLSPVGDGTELNAHSQSRIGKGDLGQNARNLKELTRWSEVVCGS